jgi:hypothetical protein
MRVATVTGTADRDYIRLTAASLDECADLVDVALSQFIPRDSVRLLSQGYCLARTIELRVYIGPPKQLSLDAATRADIDATP